MTIYILLNKKLDLKPHVSKSCLPFRERKSPQFLADSRSLIVA